MLWFCTCATVFSTCTCTYTIYVAATDIANRLLHSLIQSAQRPRYRVALTARPQWCQHQALVSNPSCLFYLCFLTPFRSCGASPPFFLASHGVDRRQATYPHASSPCGPASQPARQVPDMGISIGVRSLSLPRKLAAAYMMRAHSRRWIRSSRQKCSCWIGLSSARSSYRPSNIIAS